MSDTTARLAALVADPGLNKKAKRLASQLLDRMQTPLRVVVAGPLTPRVIQISEALGSGPSLELSSDLDHADLAIWCSSSFDPDEIAIWQELPASLQDHSLLVADDGPMSWHLQTIAAQFFRHWIPLEPDADNVEPVVSCLMQHVVGGQEADEDQALALLTKYPVDLTLNQTAARAAEPLVPVSTDANPYSDAVAYLQAQASALGRQEIDDTPETCGPVLAICVESAQTLSEMVIDAPDGALNDAVFEASDAITLMIVEENIAAATDAVTTLFQLQKDLQMSVLTSAV